MLSIQVNRKSNYSIAYIQGKIDFDGKDEFDVHLHPIVSESGQNLIVDLGDVPMVTSMGIGQLVTLVSRANTKGSHVILANLSPFVKSIVATTKLDQFFELADSVEAAESMLR